MASEHVLEFTEDNFASEVLGSQQPVLVDFWAEWCGPCKMLLPVIDALATEMAGKAKVGKVDTERSQRIAMQYNITAIPTMIIFKDGKPVKTLVGLKKKDDLVAALQQAGAA
ncbi:MAG TPA: thioredoxin [Phycisphaerales bacterium]|nr:thioredoxin [Phycisphaerales bacterium]